MLKFLLCGLFAIISFILYCCLRCSSEYDRMTDDMKQKDFIKNQKSTKQF